MKKKSECIVLTPFKPKDDEAAMVRLERMLLLEPSQVDGVVHCGQGGHSGLIVRSAQSCGESFLKVNVLVCETATVSAEPSKDDELPYSVELNLGLRNAWQSISETEVRNLKFLFVDGFEEDKRSSYVHSFVELLLSNFPIDYGNFLKRLMKLMQRRFTQIRMIDVTFQTVISSKLPVSSENANEEVMHTSQERKGPPTVADVQELLEFAFPNGMTPSDMAEALQCSVETVTGFLESLVGRGLVVHLESDQWIRADKDADVQKAIGKQMPKVSRSDRPTVAIVTALYVEKLAVDAMLENRKTFVRYKTDGESNVYTLGNIGNRRVVATKLSSVGSSRSEEISSGSITTRLLGGFPEIEHVFVVGVGGVAPRASDADNEVRVGDVAVCTPLSGDQHYAYVVCDSLKKNRYTNMVESYGVKTWVQHDNVIEKIAEKVRSSPEDCLAWQRFYEEGVKALEETAKGAEFSFERPSGTEEEDYSGPRLHLGPISSSRIVSTHQNLKNNFSQHFGLVAFDVGFDMVIESVFGNRIGSWTLIRGLADYNDGTKGKKWQPYAALHAAALAKVIIFHLP